MRVNNIWRTSHGSRSVWRKEEYKKVIEIERNKYSQNFFLDWQVIWPKMNIKCAAVYALDDIQCKYQKQVHLVHDVEESLPLFEQVFVSAAPPVSNWVSFSSSIHSLKKYEERKDGVKKKVIDARINVSRKGWLDVHSLNSCSSSSISSRFISLLPSKHT